MRDLESHRDARALLGIDLLAQDGIEEVEIRRLGARGVVEHGVEALGHVAQAKSRECLDDAGVHDGGHRAPPTTAA